MSDSPPTFQETLRLPLWWAVATLVVTLLAAAEVHSGSHGLRAVLPYAVLPTAALAAIVAVSRQQVRVADGMLHVQGARAPLTAFGPAEVLDRQQLRLWLGPQAHRDAWVAVRPWMRTGVRLPVIDPEDDTPYWLVGTRDPVALAAALA